MILKPRLFRKPRKGHWATKNLVGLWLFNEGSGNKVFDLSGNNNTGTLLADTHFVPGENGCAIILDGTDDYVEVENSSSLDISVTDTLTLIARFRYTASMSFTKPIILKSHTSHVDPYYNWGLLHSRTDTTNRGSFVVTVGGTDYWVFSSEDSLSINKWHTLAGIYDGTNLNLYVDGNLDGQTAASGAISNSNKKILFGAYENLDKTTNYCFIGNLNYVMIYSRALSYSEIALLHREPFCMFERDPIELWSAATIGAPPVGNAGIMTPNTGFWGPTF